MNRSVFVDTSAWVNVADRSAVHHAAAAQVYAQLLSEGVELVSTGFILAETHVLLRRRMSYAVAQEFLRKLNHSPRIRVVYPGLSVETAAKEILEKFADQDFSLTDAISFVVMREENLREAFSYDSHFLTAGFVLVNALSPG